MRSAREVAQAAWTITCLSGGDGGRDRAKKQLAELIEADRRALLDRIDELSRELYWHSKALCQVRKEVEEGK